MLFNIYLVCVLILFFFYLINRFNENNYLTIGDFLIAFGIGVLAPIVVVLLLIGFLIASGINVLRIDPMKIFNTKVIWTKQDENEYDKA